MLTPRVPAGLACLDLEVMTVRDIGAPEACFVPP